MINRKYYLKQVSTALRRSPITALLGMIKKNTKKELRNLLRMKHHYEQELMKLPKGSLVRKKVREQYYYYYY